MLDHSLAIFFLGRDRMNQLKRLGLGRFVFRVHADFDSVQELRRGHICVALSAHCQPVACSQQTLQVFMGQVLAFSGLDEVSGNQSVASELLELNSKLLRIADV